jgi:hypothetical protein
MTFLSYPAAIGIGAALVGINQYGTAIQLREIVAQVKGDMTKMEVTAMTAVVALKGDMARMEAKVITEVGALKGDMGVLKAELAGTKAELTTLKAEVTSMKAEILQRLDAQASNLLASSKR